MRRAARNSVSPFREGFNARLAGKVSSDNPYPIRMSPWPRDPKRMGWADGWNAAEAQLNKQGKAKEGDC